MLYLQTLFCPSRFYQPLVYLFLGTRLCLLHFFTSHSTRLTGTPLVPGTATWHLLPLMFSYSPCSRCCCYSFGLNSTGLMHFLDVINFPVTGPQCSYQVMHSTAYIGKTKGSFCQRSRRKIISFLSLYSYTMHESPCLTKGVFKITFLTRFQCNKWGTCTSCLFPQAEEANQLTERTFHQTKAGEMIGFSTRFSVAQYQLASVTATETIIFRFFLPFIFRSASPCSLFGLFAFFFWGISGRILKE